MQRERDCDWPDIRRGSGVSRTVVSSVHRAKSPDEGPSRMQSIRGRAGLARREIEADHCAMIPTATLSLRAPVAFGALLLSFASGCHHAQTTQLSATSESGAVARSPAPPLRVMSFNLRYNNP